MPKAPPKPCTKPGCRKYATARGRCDDHQVTHNWDHRGKSRHERGYGSTWDKLKKQAEKRDKHLCQICLKKGICTKSDAVDHIIPKSQGGTDALTNLQCICKDCHTDKTQKEAKHGRYNNHPY